MGTTLVAALGGAYIGGKAARNAALASARIHVEHDERMRQLEDAKRIHERGAEVLGRVKDWLKVADPGALIARQLEDPAAFPEVLRELQYRLGQLTLSLYVFSASHPSEAVARSAEQVDSLLEWTWAATRALLQSSDPNDPGALIEPNARWTKTWDTTVELENRLRSG
jgi:hypothetical protein